MTLSVRTQPPAVIRPYDLGMTAEAMELDTAQGLSMAEKAYVAIRDRLILLDIRPNDPIDDGALAQFDAATQEAGAADLHCV